MEQADPVGSLLPWDCSANMEQAGPVGSLLPWDCSANMEQAGPVGSLLQKIYKIADATLARRKLRAWCRWVGWVAGKSAPALFAAMVKTAKLIERHLAGVMAPWLHGTTNAFLEGLNSVFSAVKGKARAFRSTKNLITMLYFTAGRLDLPATH
ncbi:MAG: hypothetical protein RL077_5390 [Verrucomicrobiota bacterium]